MDLFDEITLRSAHGGYPAGTVGTVVDFPVAGSVTMEIDDDLRRDDDDMGVLDLPVSAVAAAAGTAPRAA